MDNNTSTRRSIFELPSGFLDSCRLLESPSTYAVIPDLISSKGNNTYKEEEDNNDDDVTNVSSVERLTCNTCKSSFDSLQDQRSHFKSDFHRFNVKLTVAGKDTVNEDDFDETSDSFVKDYDISSISGSEDEDDERDSSLRNDMNKGLLGSSKTKIFVHLANGDIVSFWKCLFLDDTVRIIFEQNKSSMLDDVLPCVTEREMTERLRNVIHEPRDKTNFRVMLLASGGHFAGCVFDGNSVVAHKTFHRYVIRAKAGKKQSSKDASGKIAHSAGASIRRYNELALKKEIRELLAAWKPYFDASSSIFIHAPSDSRLLLFDGDTPCFSCQKNAIRRIPLTVRRPTFKEARRLYNILTQVSSEQKEETVPIDKEDLKTTHTQEALPGSDKKNLENNLDSKEVAEASIVNGMEDMSISNSEGKVTVISTPLHEAAKAGNVEKVLELLEQGLDPCVIDERGRTPYMLATEKEVRNTFRRFMALNLDKWDWQAAKVPSPLTKEMEESQNAKQAEKDAKRKARAKELKKLKKAREKKAEAEAAQLQKAAAAQAQSSRPQMTKEEKLKQAQAEEREKRAAAAERRIAALQSSTSQPNTAASSDTLCSFCKVSLVGKVPFHRYNYKYCSTSCMDLHREILENE